MDTAAAPYNPDGAKTLHFAKLRCPWSGLELLRGNYAWRGVVERGTTVLYSGEVMPRSRA